uniref:ATP synthase F0 subunit 8 n=1 Tax=Eucinostomus gula TaxID=435273 RepID=UPI0028FCEC3B|nr:ATP synthase F0 subunit 8 [Eucinostomus gula]WNH21456.1 ATP synthase F0 subunit 8 [Eucinostomus gula]WNH37968.1 ATP synthase F0 subunit 8 [Eucinostomus gula]
MPQLETANWFSYIAWAWLSLALIPLKMLLAELAFIINQAQGLAQKAGWYWTW